jgi:hypothetical protein
MHEVVTTGRMEALYRLEVVLHVEDRLAAMAYLLGLRIRAISPSSTAVLRSGASLSHSSLHSPLTALDVGFSSLLLLLVCS